MSTSPIPPTQLNFNSIGTLATSSFVTSAIAKPVFTITGHSGRASPNSEKFDARAKTEAVYIADFRLDGFSDHIFTYQVWEEIFKNMLDDYGTIILKDGAYPAFLSRSNRDAFEAWLHHYLEYHFGGKEQVSMLPRLPEGKINGYMIDDRDIDLRGYVSFNSMNCLKEWAWIIMHCHHKVYRVVGGWIFENLTDSVFFKMRPEDNGAL